MDNVYAQSHETLLARLAAKGDREAFAELVRRNQGWLRGLLLRGSGDPALADDLAQQAFLQAWRRLSQLRDPSRFHGWLRRLALNEWMQQLRKRDPLALAEEWQPDDMARGEPTALARDLDTALATLPVPVRLCIVLAYQEGMSHGEISELTGVPLGTVKSHIRRGGAALRQCLGAYREQGGEP